MIHYLIVIILNCYCIINASRLKRIIQIRMLLENQLTIDNLDSSCLIFKTINLTNNTVNYITQDDIRNYNHKIERYFNSFSNSTIFNGKWKSKSSLPILDSNQGDILLSIE